MSTPIKPKKVRKPKTKRLYFGPEVDISIVKYNTTSDFVEKSTIYQKEIKPAFENQLPTKFKLFSRTTSSIRAMWV